MFKLGDFSLNPKPRVLFLGAHPDDIEIGCGATLLRLINEAPDAELQWVVFSGNTQRHTEATESANIFLNKVKTKKVILKSFKDGYFPFVGDQIKDFFEELKREFKPDMVLTHYLNDAHQDHRLISSLTWNTFRDSLIFEYEIPKYDGDLSTPNMYVYVDESLVYEKIRIIIDCFRSQKERKWFNEETFKSILIIRGVESNSPTRYAEAFYCRKMIL